MKKFAIVIAVITVLSAFTSCGKKVECDFCGEMKHCEEKNVYGETMFICDNCYDELRELAE